MSTIGSAAGSIIAAIITAHIAPIASTFGALQPGVPGIVSCTSGWPMSKAIQPSTAQAPATAIGPARPCRASSEPPRRGRVRAGNT